MIAIVVVFGQTIMDKGTIPTLLIPKGQGECETVQGADAPRQITTPLYFLRLCGNHLCWWFDEGTIQTTRKLVGGWGERW